VVDHHGPAGRVRRGLRPQEGSASAAAAARAAGSARSSAAAAAGARAGVTLSPGLAYRTLAYAVHPSWTRGHAFTVAQEIADPAPQRWHVIVRDGAPVAVARQATAPPDATVTMSRAAFAHLLRREPAPSGERPIVRGDRAAVALLREWTERAQGHGG
jgi:hypothetical protein